MKNPPAPAGEWLYEMFFLHIQDPKKFAAILLLPHWVVLGHSKPHRPTGATLSREGAGAANPVFPPRCASTTKLVSEELQCDPGAPHTHWEFVPVSQTHRAPLSSVYSQRDAGRVLWDVHQYMVMSKDIWKFASEMHFWPELKHEPTWTPATVKPW